MGIRTVPRLYGPILVATIGLWCATQMTLPMASPWLVDGTKTSQLGGLSPSQRLNVRCCVWSHNYERIENSAFRFVNCFRPHPPRCAVYPSTLQQLIGSSDPDSLPSFPSSLLFESTKKWRRRCSTLSSLAF